MMATCAECDETFPAKRLDARCCSPRCRQAKSRRLLRMRGVANARETPSVVDRASAPGPASDEPGVTDHRGGYLTLIVRPHIEERNGCRFHLDRFDAYLDGELILISRQASYDGARELLRRGYPRDSLLTLRHADQDDDCFVPLEIGYLALWSVSDSDRGGLKRIRWRPMPKELKKREG